MSLSCSKQPSTLLKGMISKHHGNFCCLNCLCSFKTENRLKSHEKVCKDKNIFAKGKNYGNVRNHCHYTSKYTGTANSIYNLKLNVPNKIPIVFYNDSNYDYHFSIKELSNGFEGQFKCRAENKEKYKTFFVPIKLFQEIKKIYKDGNKSVVNISCKIKFSDLWQVHYQILMIISQKEFIKLNVKIVIVVLDMKVSRTV